jgi:hypothetical protein
VTVKKDEGDLAKALVSFLDRATSGSSTNQPPQWGTETFEATLRMNLRNLLLADRSETARNKLIIDLTALFSRSSAKVVMLRGLVALATDTADDQRLRGLHEGVMEVLGATAADYIGGLSHAELADRISQALNDAWRRVDIDRVLRRHRVQIVLMFLGPTLIALDVVVVPTPAFRIIHPATVMFASLGYVTLIVTFVVQGRTSRRAG